MSPNQFPVNPKSSWKHIKAHDKNLKITHYIPLKNFVTPLYADIYMLIFNGIYSTSQKTSKSNPVNLELKWKSLEYTVSFETVAVISRSVWLFPV